jgi:Ca-activated chloride channel homolog
MGQGGTPRRHHLRSAAALCGALWALPVAACDTALMLAIDVSNSVDVGEYRLQIDGVADALRDPEIAAALVEGQIALSLMQWSGVDRQQTSLDWARMTTPADVLAFSEAARQVERAFILSDTAPAEAVAYALARFADVPDCGRHVLDVSGDGTPNAGSDVRAARLAAERAGVTINGIAIESLGVAITGFFQRALITRDGFVVTARGHSEYPRAIRDKILREISEVLG